MGLLWDHLSPEAVTLLDPGLMEGGYPVRSPLWVGSRRRLLFLFTRGIIKAFRVQWLPCELAALASHVLRFWQDNSCLLSALMPLRRCFKNIFYSGCLVVFSGR